MEKKQYQLPKEFGEKWVAELRKNEIKQIKGEFHQVIEGEDCFCANGLAFHANGFKFVPNHLSKVFNGNGGTFSAWTNSFISINLIDKIVELNDAKDLSFPEIADWLEANVEFI